VPVGELRRSVVDELGLPIGREQPDLLARKKRGRVDQVTLDHRSGRSLESGRDHDLDRYDALAITFADDGVVGQAVPEVEDIARRVRLEIETASFVGHLSSSLSPRAHAEPYPSSISAISWRRVEGRGLT